MNVYGCNITINFGWFLKYQEWIKMGDQRADSGPVHLLLFLCRRHHRHRLIQVLFHLGTRCR